MLAKLTSKNQITIPKAILSQVPKTTHFDVAFRDGAIILQPVQVTGSDVEEIRRKMASLGLGEDSVAEAVRWARER